LNIPVTFFSIFGNFRADRMVGAALEHDELEHDEDVIQMNEVRRRASGWVQRRNHKVAA
jgi:hypothetical protein